MNTSRLSLLPILVAVLAATAGPAAAAQGSLEFTAEPAPRSSLDREGGYFRLAVSPGRTFEQALVLRNLSQRPVELRLAAADAHTGSYGGVSYGLPGAVRARVGKWITLDRQTVRLRAGSAARVGFTVSVPGGALGGEHLGGITVAAAPSGEIQGVTPGAGQAGASLNIQTRRVIAVLVRVPGPAVPRLVVTGIAPVARADGIYLDIGIANRGTALTKAKGEVSISGDGFRNVFDVDTFVPGTATAYPVKWAQSARDGEHRATVELRYGARVARWEGTFTIGEKLDAGLVERGAPGRIEASGPSTLALAAIAAAGATGATLLIAAAIWLLSRRRRARVGRPPLEAGPSDADRRAPSLPTAPARSSIEAQAASPPATANAVPLVAATAVALGSVAWLVLRRSPSRRN